jgi:F0F1-type ATP synthase delta subunit
MEHKSAEVMRLPLMVISPVDIARLYRELTALDEYLVQQKLRDSAQVVSLPRTSRLLDDVAKLNNFDLLEKKERERLLKFLDNVSRQAPVLHFSFAADPSAAFMSKIVEWLRSETHPLALIQVGLQPSIAAGCVLRTENKYFDFSLRRHFLENRQLLIDRLGDHA